MNHSDLSLSVIQALLRGRDEAAGPQPPARPPFSITISREPGALGSTVAGEVGRRLGWPVYDREILVRVAEAIHRPTFHLQGVDERARSWLEEALSGLLSEYAVSSGAYLKYLIGTVRGLAAGGRCVIVGRGANFILPAATTLRVRLVASPEDRARVVALRFNLPPREAAAWAERTERERAEFVRRSFGKDPADPHHYDLVLNTSRVSAADAADAVVGMLRRLEGSGPPAGQAGGPAAQPVLPGAV
jgi:cytidylate kinase